MYICPELNLLPISIMFSLTAFLERVNDPSWRLSFLVGLKAGGRKVRFCRMLDIPQQRLTNWFSRKYIDSSVVLKALPEVNSAWLLLDLTERDVELIPSEREGTAGVLRIVLPTPVWQPAAEDLVYFRSLYAEVAGGEVLVELDLRDAYGRPVHAGSGEPEEGRDFPTRAAVPNYGTVQAASSTVQGQPYFDVDFSGGFYEFFQSPDQYPSDYVAAPLKCDVWCNLVGTSMEPDIKNGDLIALRQIHSVDDVLYGHIYAVVLDTLRTVKILRKAERDTHLRFIPINAQEYDEQEFEKERIISLFEVVGTLKRF